MALFMCFTIQSEYCFTAWWPLCFSISYDDLAWEAGSTKYDGAIFLTGTPSETDSKILLSPTAPCHPLTSMSNNYDGILSLRCCNALNTRLGDNIVTAHRIHIWKNRTREREARSFVFNMGFLLLDMKDGIAWIKLLSLYEVCLYIENNNCWLAASLWRPRQQS